MFTGIIDHVGTITALTHKENAIRATIHCEFATLTEGESIAVDGICLTVIEPQTKSFSCDISPETLQLTTASAFTIGRIVNLERALCMGDRLGGHWVTGHVDQRGRLSLIKPQKEFTELQISEFLPETRAFLLKKGCITVNGVSLTLNEIAENSFSVMLIPHTLQRTNLQYLRVNDTVNLEFDWMAKIIFNQLKQLEINRK
jgi:riboflavin synthase